MAPGLTPTKKPEARTTVQLHIVPTGQVFPIASLSIIHFSSRRRVKSSIQQAAEQRAPSALLNRNVGRLSEIEVIRWVKR